MSANPGNGARQRISDRVRRVEIGTRRLSSDAFHGGVQSRFRGRGMDFDEVREYEPGDDVRAIETKRRSVGRRPTTSFCERGRGSWPTTCISSTLRCSKKSPGDSVRRQNANRASYSAT